MLPDVLNPTPLVAEVLPLFPPRRDKLTLIVKGTFEVRHDGRTRLAPAQLPLTGDEHEGDGTTPVRYESDLVPFKPRADLLCVGRAHAPGGQPVASLAVRFGLLDRPKEIRVVGDRRLRMVGGTPEIGPPEPFTSMDLSYCRAFGGADPEDPVGASVCPTNPLGRGYARRAGAQRDRLMPNLEDPRQPLGNLAEPQAPAGFGPIGRTWQPRVALAGTYDARWQTERAPEPPEDFDYRFFNAAPPDQQIEGYLRGDESLFIENMHPELSRLTVGLPGVRIRAFVEAAPDLQRDAPAGLRELRLRLDTVWLDMEGLRLVLVWRAALYASHVAEGGALLIGAERIADEPKPVGIHAAQLAALRAEELAVEVEAEKAERSLAN